jgi:hypothetical protein
MMGLFTSEKTVVNHSSPYKAIGYGSTFAELFLGNLWGGGMSVEQAEILAAYVVFLAKESVETCGKFTTIATIRGPEIKDSPNGSCLLPTTEATFVEPTKIEEWEHLFSNKWRKVERENLFAMIDNEISKDPMPKPSTSRKSAGRR